MIAIVTLCVCIAILALLLIYPAYARLMAGIMARQLEEKAPRDEEYGELRGRLANIESKLDHLKNIERSLGAVAFRLMNDQEKDVFFPNDHSK